MAETSPYRSKGNGDCVPIGAERNAKEVHPSEFCAVGKIVPFSSFFYPAQDTPRRLDTHPLQSQCVSLTISSHYLTQIAASSWVVPRRRHGSPDSSNLAKFSAQRRNDVLSSLHIRDPHEHSTDSSRQQDPIRLPNPLKHIRTLLPGGSYWPFTTCSPH